MSNSWRLARALLVIAALSGVATVVVILDRLGTLPWGASVTIAACGVGTVIYYRIRKGRG